MPDEIIKKITAVISAKDETGPGLKSYQDKLDKLAAPQYITGKSPSDEYQLQSMKKFYQFQAQEAQKLRQLDRTAEEQNIRDLTAQKIRAMRETAREARIEQAANTRLFGAPQQEGSVQDIQREAGQFAGASERSQASAAPGRAQASASSILDTAVRVRIAMDIIKGSLDLIDGGMKLWAGYQADVANNFEKATEGYLGFAASVKNIPIVGGVAYQASEMLSGGAGAAAEKSMADAKRVDEETKRQLNQRKADQIDGAKETARLQEQFDLAHLDGDEKLHRAELYRYIEQVSHIKELQKENKISQDTMEKLLSGSRQEHFEKDLGIDLKTAEAKAAARRREQEEDDRATKEHEAEAKRTSERQAEEELKADEKQRKTLDAQNQIQKELQDITVDELKAEGHLSNSQEKRLEIADKYNSKHKELLKIINDEHSTDAQKADAQKLLSGLAGSEKQAIAESLRQHRRGTAGAEAAGALHGLAITSETRAKDPTDVIAGHVKQSAETAKRIQDLVDALVRNLTGGDKQLLVARG